jgi:hypothetical protein
MLRNGLPRIWRQQPARFLRVAPRFLPYVDFAQNLWEPPEIAGFTKTGTIDRTASVGGIGYKGDGSTGYYSRTVSVTANQSHWILVSFVHGSTVSTTNKQIFTISDSAQAASTSAYIGLYSGSSGLSSSLLDARYRGITSGVVMEILGPLPVDGGVYNCLFYVVDGTETSNTFFVNGVAYTDSGASFTPSATYNTESFGARVSTTIVNYGTQNVLMAARGHGKLPPLALARDLSINPWQLWEDERRYWAFGVTAGGTDATATGATVTATASAAVSGQATASSQTAAATVTATSSAIAGTPTAASAATGVTVTATASWVRGNAGPAQFMRPIADIAANGWQASTGSDLYAMLDESPMDSGDYIFSPDNPTTQAFEVKLGSSDDPQITDGHTLRIGLQAINQDTNFDLYLVQGTSVLDAWTESVTVTAGVVTRARAFAPAVIASITNRADVRIRGVARA